MASVTELAGRVRAPVTFKLVVVTEVAVRLVIVVPAKLVVPVMFKLVPVALVKFKLAIVPTTVKFGKEVEAEMARKVLVAVAG